MAPGLIAHWVENSDRILLGEIRGTAETPRYVLRTHGGGERESPGAEDLRDALERAIEKSEAGQQRPGETIVTTSL